MDLLVRCVALTWSALEIGKMVHRSSHRWARPLASLLVLFATQYGLPRAAAGQQPPPGAQTRPLLQGVVVHETTGQPIESATVTLVGTNLVTQTGKFGDFAFPDVLPGLVSIRVTSPEHPSMVQEVELKADAIAFVQFVLPSVSAVLSELLVGVPQRNANVAEPETAADLLVNKAPRFMGTNNGIVGKDDGVLNLRGVGSFSAGVQPLVFIDGVRISTGETALEALGQIPASQVLDIQVLQGPAAAFLYPMAANGVVLVRTKR